MFHWSFVNSSIREPSGDGGLRFAVPSCQGPQILIDGKYLAMQLIVDGKALGLRQLVASDIHALDTYIQRCKFFGPGKRRGTQRPEIHRSPATSGGL